jgi:hypothetical protein
MPSVRLVRVDEDCGLCLAGVAVSARSGSLDPSLLYTNTASPEEDLQTGVAPLIVEELLIPIVPIGLVDDDVERR